MPRDKMHDEAPSTKGPCPAASPAASHDALRTEARAMTAAANELVSATAPCQAVAATNDGRGASGRR